MRVRTEDGKSLLDNTLVFLFILETAVPGIITATTRIIFLSFGVSIYFLFLFSFTAFLSPKLLCMFFCFSSVHHSSILFLFVVPLSLFRDLSCNVWFEPVKLLSRSFS